MPFFDDLGLRQELLRALEDEDIERPTALQEAVIPALRRGSNLVARASSGSGKTLGYTLGVLDRLQPREPVDTEEESPTLRFLVLVPTPETAERVALSMFPLAQMAQLSLTVPGGTWGTPATQAEILVAPTAQILESVQASTIKLDNLEAVVIDGASIIQSLGDWDKVDTLLDLVPRDAQRIVVSASFPQEVQDLIERRVKRALSYPAESVIPEEPTEAPTVRIGYVLVSAREKLDVLARQLAQPKEAGGPPPVIFCRSDERAAELAEQLSVRGFVVGSAEDTEADVAVVAADATREELLEDADGQLGQTISYDVPADARTLQARHANDEEAVVLVEPQELTHLQEIARQAQWKARSIALPVDRSAAAAQLSAFRNELRRALREEDLVAQLLVLEPLLEEFGAAEVAAAATALLRNRRPAPAATPQQQAPAAAPSRTAEAGPAPATWARLYVGVGSRDEVRPGDLVGAVAGEANVPGNKVGRIEIRDNFSIVEVQADVADQVIRAVNGTTIKGRSVRVDYDRGADRSRRGSAPPMRRQGRAAPGRRTDRRPPRE